MGRRPQSRQRSPQLAPGPGKPGMEDAGTALGGFGFRAGTVALVKPGARMARMRTKPDSKPSKPFALRTPEHALGSARLGSARLGSARLGSARLGSARLGSARLGSARLGSARLGSARLGSARLGSARLGSARLGSARLGSARLGSARLGSARLGSARLGSARLGSAIIPLASSADVKRQFPSPPGGDSSDLWRLGIEGVPPSPTRARCPRSRNLPRPNRGISHTGRTPLPSFQGHFTLAERQSKLGQDSLIGISTASHALHETGPIGLFRSDAVSPAVESGPAPQREVTLPIISSVIPAGAPGDHPTTQFFRHSKLQSARSERSREHASARRESLPAAPSSAAPFQSGGRQPAVNHSARPNAPEPGGVKLSGHHAAQTNCGIPVGPSTGMVWRFHHSGRGPADKLIPV